MQISIFLIVCFVFIRGRRFDLVNGATGTILLIICRNGGIFCYEASICNHLIGDCIYYVGFSIVRYAGIIERENWSLFQVSK